MNTTGDMEQKAEDHEEITIYLSANHSSTFITPVQPEEEFKPILAFFSAVLRLEHP